MMLNITPNTAPTPAAPSVAIGDKMMHPVGRLPSAYQRTIATEISVSGIGLHSGKSVTMRLCPAGENAGITFIRTDLVQSGDAAVIAATWNNVQNTTLCSQIQNPSGASVSTIEHLMAALAAMEIDNIAIEIDGPEVPIMDGSSAPFLFLLECASPVEQSAWRKYIQILKPTGVAEKNGIGYKHATLTPSSGFSIDLDIDFPNTIIGKQRYHAIITPTSFKNEISRARTFGFMHEVEQMRANGLGLGGSLENSIVVGDAGVLNPDGLRYNDEFVRHKLLDCVGDLYLAGFPILGHVEAHRTGHGLNNQLLRALFSDSSAWQITQPGALQNSAAEQNNMTESAALSA
jgi:UDP-3-O-[3-hydroxymyristoyl] N-acetylglucosamine deacetylase